DVHSSQHFCGAQYRQATQSPSPSKPQISSWMINILPATLSPPLKNPYPNINTDDQKNPPSGKTPLSRLKNYIVLKNLLKNKNRPAVRSHHPTTESIAHAFHCTLFSTRVPPRI